MKLNSHNPYYTTFDNYIAWRKSHTYVSVLDIHKEDMNQDVNRNTDSTVVYMGMDK